MSECIYTNDDEGINEVDLPLRHFHRQIKRIVIIITVHMK